MGYHGARIGLQLNLVLSKRQKVLFFVVVLVLLVLLILSIFYGPPWLWIYITIAILIFWFSLVCYASTGKEGARYDRLRGARPFTS